MSPFLVKAALTKAAKEAANLANLNEDIARVLRIAALPMPERRTAVTQLVAERAEREKTQASAEQQAKSQIMAAKRDERDRERERAGRAAEASAELSRLRAAQLRHGSLADLARRSQELQVLLAAKQEADVPRIKYLRRISELSVSVMRQDTDMSSLLEEASALKDKVSPESNVYYRHMHVRYLHRGVCHMLQKLMV
ncbi:hypothetical protein KIPB_003266 [Kipferlia bialata]|uniref:Uncharacterized protein n=1 Tax=Kipferlia bialata TaxID=797122 RepID=A0A9K3CRX2_9EUKA|nr:hypothetical protein KIPB_003266 [Kipferlia bialata]|eukprot:g3266.t1